MGEEIETDDGFELQAEMYAKCGKCGECAYCLSVRECLREIRKNADLSARLTTAELERDRYKANAVGQWIWIEDEKPEVGRRVLIQLFDGIKHYVATVSDHHHYHFKGDKYDFEVKDVVAFAYIQSCRTTF